MDLNEVSDNLQIQLRELIAQRIGLHFPPGRWRDLQRGLSGAFEELGFADLTSGAEWLLSTPLTKAQLEVLVSHLTIGETYFFRETKTFQALSEKIISELVHLRRKGNRRLRIWSAACCTGEEPYSIAIMLQQAIPDLGDWHVTILATDINARFLQQAVAGVYGEWSFRGTAASLRDRYFKRTKNGRYAILPEIKNRVTFAQVNLVQDLFPSLTSETNAMDLIFCRNVLMYFSPSQAQKVVHNLRRALVHGGWLVVSPTEASHTLFTEFTPVNFPGVILYQKGHVDRAKVPSSLPSTVTEGASGFASTFELSLPQMPLVTYQCAQPMTAPAKKEPGVHEQRHAIAQSLYECGQYAEVVDTLLSSTDTNPAPDLRTFSILTRALANQGKLAEALTWSERWVNADKLDASSHYLRAVILQELGDVEQSRRSLQTATYLDPRFVLAHFALGNLARSLGNFPDAKRHFANASHLLRDHKTDDVLPESDGLTANRLTEIITTITAMQVTP
ncbi:MAG TPA: CheR family methyltransferase [Pyrinomonadaceae bacterium]|nr:CheR family methyltransferase [Pyrinomonadaceae bacterium]